jgi:CotH kinase protein/Lamin Tail Domain/Chitobiase/beta-hexosaminidase C-terminal domain
MKKLVSILLFSASLLSSQAQQLLIPRGSSWKFENSGTDLGSSWVSPGYDDSTWGGPLPAPLGDNLDNAIQAAASVINIGPSGSRFPVVYYRKTFTVSNAAGYQGLTLRVRRDDYVAVFINGTRVMKDDGIPEPLTYQYTGGSAAADDGVNYTDFSIPSTALVNGVNVIAAANYQQAAGSSDLIFDLELEGSIDITAPTISGISPTPGSTLLDITFINVLFSEGVTNVNASDLLINGQPATNLVVNNPNDYTFYFPRPPVGNVDVAWAAGHGITDTSPQANPFAGGSWSYTYDPSAAMAQFIINEFMTDNSTGIRDDDANRSDWIELANIGPVAGNLDGYYLTDEATNLTKWRFPSVSINANNYLLVWASAKDRTNNANPLHTNFKLGKTGGYLALVAPNGTVISEFNGYPAQTTDVSYGRVVGSPNLVGYFTTPTPRAQNSTSGTGFMPTPLFSVDTGIYTNASLSLVITASAGTIRYTTDGSVPATNSPVYSAPITLSVNSTIKARVFPPADSTLFPSEVVAKNYVFLDNTTVDFNSNLPLMIISTEGRGIASEIPPGGSRTKGSITIIDVDGTRSSLRGASDFQVLAGFEFYGQTSIGFAKKPIRVETQDALGNDVDVSILGMPKDSDYKIRNPYDDKSMLNDYLSAEYFEKMGHYSLRRRFVEAFVDQGGGRLNYAADYYGIMVILENIKIGSDRVDIPQIPNTATNEPTISGGYIFKKDKDSTGDLNFSSSGGGGFGGIPLKFHEPKPNDLRVTPVTGALTAAGNAQFNYLRNFINRMEQALYAANWTTLTGTNHYSYYLDVDSFVDFHWLIEFTKQIDGYRISNYYHKDRNGKIKEGPAWDFNLAFGNANYLLGGQTNGWYYDQLGQGDHPWLRRLITGTVNPGDSAGDPDFTQKIADRWGFLRTNVFNGTNVLKRIDELAGYLNEAANRDLTKYNSFGVYYWPNPDGGVATAGSVGSADGRDVDYVRPRAYNDGTTNSIIGQMKKYMLGRYIWIDNQFVPAPAISATDGQVTNGFTVTITPAPGASVFYTLNGTDPRLPGGAVSPAAISNNGPVTLTINSNVRIVARSQRGASWKNTWSPPASVSLYTSIPPLRITEIMYNPAGTNSSALEYIEVKNISASPLNLSGFSLIGGVQFQFPTNVALAAGQSAVVVSDTNAFVAYYGSSALVLGAFTGNLNNAGDQLVLLGPLQEGVLNFSFNPDWQPATDGQGFSLVTVNENAPTSAWNTSANWRASTAIGGSPGAVDSAPPSRPGILITELLSNEDLPAGDAVELYNPTASPVNLTGWFLTDDFSRPKRYTIPFGTTIPAGGYLVIYGTNSFEVNGTNSFGFSSFGEAVYLFSGNGVDLTGYAHGFDFGAAAKDVTFGRYINSQGEEHFVAQTANTLGATNSSPLVGPVVISEIQYHPPDIGASGVGYNDTEAEFIELQNISASPVALYDAAFPTNRWHLRNAVDFDFNTNLVLQPGGFVLVVGFDPANNGTLPGQEWRGCKCPSGWPLDWHIEQRG